MKDIRTIEILTQAIKDWEASESDNTSFGFCWYFSETLDNEKEEDSIMKFLTPFAWFHSRVRVKYHLYTDEEMGLRAYWFNVDDKKSRLEVLRWALQFIKAIKPTV